LVPVSKNGFGYIRYFLHKILLHVKKDAQPYQFRV
jgi:hypothetical protein